MKMVEQFKRRILDLAIRGKLVPQDPNDESASVLLERIREERAELVKAGKIKKDKQPSRIVIGSDGAAYEKFGDGVLLAAKNAKDARTGRVVHPHVAESGRAALVAAVEVPFNLPDGWAWARLDTLCQSIADGDHQAPPQTQTGIPFLVISNVSDGELNFTNTRFVGDDYYESLLPARIPSQGNILVTVTGSYGIVVRVDTDKPFCFQRHMALIKCCGECTDYLFNALQCVVIKRYFDTIATGTAQKTIALNHLRKTLIPLPPLAEQKRIVARIEELFAVAGALGTAAEGLGNAARRLDRKILDLAIRGKLVPQNPDDEPASELLKRMSATSHKSPYGNGKAAQARRAQRNDSLSAASTPLRDDPPPPFAIPNSWEWVRLGDVSKIVRGSGIKRNETSVSGVQCVRYGEIYTHYSESFNKAVSFVPQTVADKCHEAKFGDVLCTLTGENEVEIAKATAYLGHEKLVIGGDLARISDHPYVPILLAYFMFSPFMISQKASVCTGGMIVHMGKAALSNLFIPLPPLAEQKRIVAKIEALRSVLKSFFM